MRVNYGGRVAFGSCVAFSVVQYACSFGSQSFEFGFVLSHLMFHLGFLYRLGPLHELPHELGQLLETAGQLIHVAHQLVALGHQFGVLLLERLDLLVGCDARLGECLDRGVGAWVCHPDRQRGCVLHVAETDWNQFGMQEQGMGVMAAVATSVAGSAASAVWNSPWAMASIKTYVASYVAWNYGPTILFHSGIYLGRRVIVG